MEALVRQAVRIRVLCATAAGAAGRSKGHLHHERGSECSSHALPQSFGCAVGLLSEAIPARDVTKLVSVARGGLRFNMSTKHFECSITLTNDSRQSIRAPISLAVDLSLNVTLVNAHGTTCAIHPMGRKFVTIPMPGQELRPLQALAAHDE